ncbi:MAG: hypothetical protein GY717_16745 [Rhodobacteraceae bacterium]|nr:hypothetical protein [Paracoccaceae bacterium]
MLGEVLHSFFFGMPAVLAVVASFGMRTSAARRILFWGGLVFSIPIWAGLLGMLVCDGRLLTGFSNCLVGSPVERFLAAANPLLSQAVYAYILLGPPLAGLAWLLDRRGGPRPA